MLEVVVPRPGGVAGKEARQRPGRLGEVDDRDHEEPNRRGGRKDDESAVVCHASTVVALRGGFLKRT